MVILLATVVLVGCPTPTGDDPPDAPSPGTPGDAGTLDADFGSGGFYEWRIEENAILHEGRIVEATGSGRSVTLSRKSVAGDLDTSFGTGGSVTVTLPETFDTFSVVSAIPTRIIQTGSRYLVGGSFGVAVDENGAFALAVTTSGTPDASFGNTAVDGLAMTYDDTPTGETDWGEQEFIHVQSSGRVVLMGRSTIGGTNRMVTVGFTSAGAIDTTYGGSGTGYSIFGESDAPFHGAVADASDNIYVPVFVAGQKIGLWRILPNGTPDASFDGDGFLESNGLSLDMFFAISVAESIALDSSGRILIAGGISDSTTYRVGVVAYLPSGVRDTTFGGDYNTDGTPDGFVVFDRFNVTNVTTERADEIEVDGADNIILGAVLEPEGSGRFDLHLFRLDSDGALDPEFGTDGVTVLPDADDSNSVLNDMFITADGKLMINARDYLYQLNN